MDSSVITYVVEFIIGGIIVWIAFVGVLYYCIKDIKVKREYDVLEEESTQVGEKRQGGDLSAKEN